MKTPTTLPTDFLEKVKEILPPEEMKAFLEATLRPLRKSVRFNRLKTNHDDDQRIADRHAWTMKSIPWCRDGYWIDHDNEAPLGNVAEHMNGQFYIQEASSMLPPMALAYAVGERPFEQVLDMAAAPGSKTTQLAAIMSNKGVLVANEYSGSRIKGLYSNLVRCGVKNGALTHYDGRVFGEYLPQMFDAILLDAPCSGEGTIRKDPDAFKNWSEESVVELSDTQKALMESAFKALKPGGTLIYSTCTLNHQENQQVCEHLLNTYRDAIDVIPLNELFDGAEIAATPEGYLHIWPHHYDSEGFFVSAFRKHGECPNKLLAPREMPAKFPFHRPSRKQQAEIQTEITAQYECSLDGHSLWQRDREIWLFPDALLPMIPKMKFDRLGIKVGEQHRKELRISHEFAIAFGSTAINKHELSPPEAEAYFMGKDIENRSQAKRGDIICTYRGTPIGLARVTGSRLKNKLPRELVRDQGLTFK
ncbi:16S rRNA (cytosine(1407)-C(5))-methyltransferase RsmF [Corallincola spongiicola]|uniref:16S rRNA (Cytosine(1407)-C(5))-methyltransferase RsmF n=1 Tax=Corallincola spongiicola TaxID=2520508 RepID=A0ABY1WTY8_9GAMM|nr:16S rRNA (cytosine(1407)-C(5))-methyltransferase RsmF [Corallincola spongiicola]TAA48195.1 16S rRNA (cytosine(1407)-C(5))-methyltransferase RsmF [Corallincola spongiicola]